MKHVSRIIRIIVLVCCFGVMWAEQPCAQEHLTFSSVQSSVRGLIFKEILTEAYQRIGITIKFTPYPAQRGLIYADRGTTDGEAGRLKKIKHLYPNLLMVPVPIFINNTTAFTKHLDLKVTKWDDLRPYSINTMIGLKHTEEKLKGFERVINVARIQDAFKKLNMDRTDIVIFSLYDGLNIINKLGLENIRALSFEEISSYHFIHQKHSALLPAITEALQQMEKEGRLNAIAKTFKKKLEAGAWLDVAQP